MLESKISKNKAKNETKNLLVVSLQCFHFHRNENKVSKHTKLGQAGPALKVERIFPRLMGMFTLWNPVKELSI